MRKKKEKEQWYFLHVSNKSVKFFCLHNFINHNIRIANHFIDMFWVIDKFHFVQL